MKPRKKARILYLIQMMLIIMYVFSIGYILFILINFYVELDDIWLLIGLTGGLAVYFFNLVMKWDCYINFDKDINIAKIFTIICLIITGILGLIPLVLASLYVLLMSLQFAMYGGFIAIVILLSLNIFWNILKVVKKLSIKFWRFCPKCLDGVIVVKDTPTGFKKYEKQVKVVTGQTWDPKSQSYKDNYSYQTIEGEVKKMLKTIFCIKCDYKKIQKYTEWQGIN